MGQVEYFANMYVVYDRLLHFHTRQPYDNCLGNGTCFGMKCIQISLLGD